MTEYMTEQEQIEQLKAWLKEYGMTIIYGVILAVIIVTAWNYWQTYTNRKLLKASATYEQMLNDRTRNDSTKANKKAEHLISHYARTPYASMAALLLARDAVNNKKYDDALEKLTWVMNHSKISGLQDIAKIRSAKILIAQNNTDKALKMLANTQDKAFQGLVDEIRGDAYLQKKNIADAKQSYQLALQQLSKEDAGARPILQMKLDNLASNTDKIEQG